MKYLTLFEIVYLYMFFGGMIFSFFCVFYTFFASKSYNKKVEEHVQILFPHSNDHEYAKQLFLPVINKIKT